VKLIKNDGVNKKKKRETKGVTFLMLFETQSIESISFHSNKYRISGGEISGRRFIKLE